MITGDYAGNNARQPWEVVKTGKNGNTIFNAGGGLFVLMNKDGDWLEDSRQGYGELLWGVETKNAPEKNGYMDGL